MQKITKNFILKFFTKYFLYGYLCLAGVLIISLLLSILLKSICFPKNLIFLFLVIPIFLLLAQFFRILFTTNYKYKYYKISLYRLKTRGFKDEYFECEMHEPCFKLIIKDILISNGYKKEFEKLNDKCKGRNLRVEKAKEKLLAEVKLKYEQSS